MSTTDSALKVAVRVRPLNPREVSQGAVHNLVTYADRNAVQVGAKQIGFHFVYGASATQCDVYEECAEPMVERVLQGFNATIFAYGQTSSGKTYTMGTSATGDGIIPRLVRDLFATRLSITVHVSMLEVYAEKCRDLLVDGTPDLPVRWMDGEFVVANLTSELVENAEETMAHLERGGELRQMGATEMNAESSRSHAVVTLIVQVVDADNPDISYRAKLNLVDLAGSERLAKTGAIGLKLKEGININKGLMALGQVFMALVKKQELATTKGQAASNAYHVNYRDSTLTRILADSLGGNSHTLMIACVSPADSNSEETTTTLRYAATVSKIKNTPHVNKDDDRTLITQLQAELERMRALYAQSQIDLREARADNPSQMVAEQTNNHGAHHEHVALLKEQVDVMADERDRGRKMLADAFVARQRAVAHEAHTLEAADLVANDIARLVDDMTTAMAAVERAEHSPTYAKTVLMECVEKAAAKMTPLVDRLNVMRAVDDDHLDRLQVPDDDGETCEALKKRVTQNEQSFIRQTKERDEKMIEVDAKLETLESKETGPSSAVHDDDTRVRLMDQNQRLEKKVHELENEKTKLGNQLTTAGHTHKLAEERRRKLVQLEKAIASDRAKLARQHAVAETHNRQCIENVKLRKELDGLKKLKATIARENTKATEAYRREKRLCEQKLKNAERKGLRDASIQRQALTSATISLKRYRDRCIHAEALNKRMRANMQGAGRNRRHAARTAKTAVDAKTLIDGELSSATDVAEAKAIRQALLDERTDLTKELHATKRKHDRVADVAQRAALLEKMQQLEEECTIRTTKLHETTNQLDELACADEDDDADRWSWVTEVPVAREALFHLFARAVDIAVERATLVEEVRVGQQTVAEHADKVVALEKECAHVGTQHRVELCQVQLAGAREEGRHNGEMRHLVRICSAQAKNDLDDSRQSLHTADLRHLADIADKYAGAGAVEQMQRRLEVCQDELAAVDKENSDYRSQVGKPRRRPFFPPIASEQSEVNPRDHQSTRSGRTSNRPQAFGGAVTGDDWSSSLASPAVSRTTKFAEREAPPAMEKISEYEDDVSDSLARTPILRNSRRSLVAARRRASEEDELDHSKTLKCSCKSACDSRRCACRRGGGECSALCKCPTACTNAKPPPPLDTTFEVHDLEEHGGLQSAKWKNSVKRQHFKPIHDENSPPPK